MIKYDFKVNPWQMIERNFPLARDITQKLSFLLRYAVLAPSSHNTQPWKFSLGFACARYVPAATLSTRYAEPEKVTRRAGRSKKCSRE